jgi:Zn-dependent membrane protease YugP
VANSRGLTGAEVARAILDTHGLTHVRVEPVPGALTDHYDPQAKAVRLSEPNYASPSLAALVGPARQVLQWAALTYVAALASSLATILYYASLLGLFGRREE